MSKIIHIIVALLTYQTGCWLLQSAEEGDFTRFHFAATIGVGILIMGQLNALLEDFLDYKG
jgi:hypothetical protein